MLNPEIVAPILAGGGVCGAIVGYSALREAIRVRVLIPPAISTWPVALARPTG
jgi:hypothetical protein